MSEYKINILPFNILREEVEIGFTLTEKKGYHRIYKNSFPKSVPDEIKKEAEKFAWWTNAPNDDDQLINVNLVNNKRFAKNYFNIVLFEYFSNQGLITNRNFINDTEIWLEDSTYLDNNLKRYNKYSLRIDDNEIIDGLSLLVAYDGTSSVLKQNVLQAQLGPDHLGKVIYQNRISSFKRMSSEEKEDVENIKAVLNRDIRRVLKVSPEKFYSVNKYNKYYIQIHDFYTKHLKGISIGGIIKIFESGFYNPYQESIGTTSEDSNLLLFGNNQKHFIPYIGMKEYGPIEPPSPDKQIKFIFIFHKDDKEYANRLHSYLKKGYKSFPGLEAFSKIQFELDTDKTVRFESEDPLPEIIKAVDNYKFDPKAIYIALYISRIKRDSEDEEEDNIYFLLKELLLKHEVTSQVIFKNNIDNPSFNYFLPNIAIAILAKLGGIPWRLYRPIKNDLVIGIGADRSGVTENHFIGCAFCFKNDGRFNGFNAFEKKDTVQLASAIKQTIEEYIKEFKEFDRLVIHYYKKMNEAEEEPIKQVLNHLNLSLPYLIVTVNDTESKDYVLFDTSFDGKMPKSGTYIKTKWNEFILCNNTRYSGGTGTKLEGFPFPVKIKIKSSNYEKINDIIVVREIIDQIYQFSRIYWKSVRQRNMPVTIEYSELVAKMLSHFSNKKLGKYARNSLWFL